jgi:hypothetical protein
MTTPDSPTILTEEWWVCDSCFEVVQPYLHAVCQDGCNRALDHDGSCDPNEHDGDRCQWCGDVDRLHLVEAANLDDDRVDQLRVRLQ